MKKSLLIAITALSMGSTGAPVNATANEEGYKPAGYRVYYYHPRPYRYYRYYGRPRYYYRNPYRHYYWHHWHRW